MSGVRGSTWEVEGESGGLDSDASSTALTTCFGQRCTLHDIVDTSQHLSLSSPPPDLRHKINIALRRRHVPAAEVSEASGFYSGASGEPSGSQTTPPDLIDSSISKDTLSAHEGKTMHQPNVGDLTWTLRSIGCVSFARS